MSSRSPFTIFQRPPSNATRFYDRVNKEHYLAVSRRSVVKTGAAMAAIGAVGVASRGSDVTAQTTADATPTTNASAVCVLTPELTEGPYYLDDMILREDVTEGKAGIPLELTILVVDSVECSPIENAAVEIWHCDALGFYSGFTENSPGGTSGYVDDGSDPDTFLRGLTLTNSDGLVTFKTIYPGWYSGRDIHIHLKVHVGGESENGTYEGGNVSHTGQIAFADEITDQVALIEPYVSKSDSFTRLEDDNVFSDVEDDDPSFFVELVPIDAADIATGFTASITFGIDPDAEQSGGGPGEMPPGEIPPN